MLTSRTDGSLDASLPQFVYVLYSEQLLMLVSLKPKVDYSSGSIHFAPNFPRCHKDRKLIERP